jgi:hypothetical protein
MKKFVLRGNVAELYQFEHLMRTCQKNKEPVR